MLQTKRKAKSFSSGWMSRREYGSFEECSATVSVIIAVVLVVVFVVVIDAAVVAVETEIVFLGPPSLQRRWAGHGRE